MSARLASTPRTLLIVVLFLLVESGFAYRNSTKTDTKIDTKTNIKTDTQTSSDTNLHKKNKGTKGDPLSVDVRVGVSVNVNTGQTSGGSGAPSGTEVAPVSGAPSETKAPLALADTGCAGTEAEGGKAKGLLCGHDCSFVIEELETVQNGHEKETVCGWTWNMGCPDPQNDPLEQFARPLGKCAEISTIAQICPEQCKSESGGSEAGTEASPVSKTSSDTKAPLALADTGCAGTEAEGGKAPGLLCGHDCFFVIEELETVHNGHAKETVCGWTWDMGCPDPQTDPKEQFARPLGKCTARSNMTEICPEQCKSD